MLSKWAREIAVGVLVPLLRILRQQPQDSKCVYRRFSPHYLSALSTICFVRNQHRFYSISNIFLIFILVISLLLLKSFKIPNSSFPLFFFRCFFLLLLIHTNLTNQTKQKNSFMDALLQVTSGDGDTYSDGTHRQFSVTVFCTSTSSDPTLVREEKPTYIFSWNTICPSSSSSTLFHEWIILLAESLW